MVEQTIRRRRQQQQQPLSFPLVVTVSNATNDTISIMCPATDALEKLIPLPEREYKRMRHRIDDDDDDIAFDMSALARVSIPIKESLGFPLIEWSIGDADDAFMPSSSSSSMEDESLSRARLFIDNFLLAAAPPSTTKSICGRAHNKKSSSPTSTICSDKQQGGRRQCSSSSFSTSTSASSSTTSLANHQHRRRLVRSIALDSRLALLDASARPIGRSSSTESTTLPDDEDSCFASPVSITTAAPLPSCPSVCDSGKISPMSTSQQDPSFLRFAPPQLSPPSQTT
jgi:hypothetical protein